ARRRFPPHEGRAVSSARGTLWAAILGSCIVFLDSSVVSVALPRMGQELPAHLLGVLEGQSYVYGGYLLAESALLILAGGMTDVYGRRRMFTLGLAGFGVTSILSGLAPTMEWLVVFRVLQGVAGALLVPGSMALITATFSGEEQGRAFGVWSGATAGLSILGPFVGGLLVDTVSWRAVVSINVPDVLITLWMTGRFVRESRDAGAAKAFDIPGTLLTALAVGGLAVGTISGQQREWHSPAALAAPGIRAAATLLLPCWFMTAGPALMALGVLWFTRIPATSPPWGLNLSAVGTFAPPAGYMTAILPGLLLFGLGAMLMVAPLTATVMASAPVEHAGVASAINNAIADVGPQLAVAALFVVLTSHFYTALAGQVPGLDVAAPAVRAEVSPLNL